MLPYKNGTKVVLDPIKKKKNDFHFGPVEKKHINEIGEITDKKYINCLRTYAYEVKLNGEKLWFKGNELL